LKRITGRAWTVRVESVSNEAAASQTPAAEKDTPTQRHRRPRAEAVQEPLLKRAMDLLGAQIVQLDEGFGTAPPEPTDRTDETDTPEEG